MEKTKAKRGTHWLARRLPFALLWAFSAAIMSALSNAFTATRFFNSLTMHQMALFLVLWVDIAGGLVQVQLIERLVKRSMRGWLVYTLIGNFITLFFANLIITSTTIPYDTMHALIPLVYLAPPLLLQTVWLWRRVYTPWLWASAAVIMSLGFNALYVFLPRLAVSLISQVLGLISGLIMGVIMHYLWAHPKDTEKAKIDFASDKDEERIERLQKREQANPLWNMGDEQAMQSEA